MRLLRRWWIRIPLYGVFIAVVAYTSYHVAYSHYPHTDDTDAENAYYMGIFWAWMISASATLILVTVESVFWLRRLSRSDAWTVGRSVRAG